VFETGYLQELTDEQLETEITRARGAAEEDGRERYWALYDAAVAERDSR
jgi:hypothetical protein